MFATSMWRLAWWSSAKLSQKTVSDDRKQRIVWARVSSVYDGDTFTVVYVQNGTLCKRRCRCAGYDAPEMRSTDAGEKQRALAAKDFLTTQLPKGIFRLKIRGLDKYGRFLVHLRIRGEDLHDVVIREGHGYAYNGGTKVK